jgi:O-antigen/teichoic acid export membrane protein
MFWRHYALTLKPVLSDMGEGKTASFYNTSRIRQNLPYFISGRLVSALGTFGSMVLIVRALSVADFGVFSIIVGSSIIFGMVCGLGIERLIPRYLSELRSAGMLGRAAYLAWLLLLARIILLLPAFLILYYLWDLVGNTLVAGCFAYAIVERPLLRLLRNRFESNGKFTTVE